MINQNTNRIMTIGNYSTGNSEGGIVVHTDGIFPAIVCGGAGHGYGFANVAVYEWWKDIGIQCKETC